MNKQSRWARPVRHTFFLLSDHPFGLSVGCRCWRVSLGEPRKAKSGYLRLAACGREVRRTVHLPVLRVLSQTPPAVRRDGVALSHSVPHTHVTALGSRSPLARQLMNDILHIICTNFNIQVSTFYTLAYSFYRKQQDIFNKGKHLVEIIVHGIKWNETRYRRKFWKKASQSWRISFYNWCNWVPVEKLTNNKKVSKVC